MSVLFSSITSYVSPASAKAAIFASIIGSNVGAFLTPIGALAGMMWMGLLKNHEVKFSFLKFAFYGLVPSIVALASALLGLYLVLL